MLTDFSPAVATTVGAGVGLVTIPVTRKLLRDREAHPGWGSSFAAAVAVLATSVVFGLLAWRLPPGGVLVAALCFAAIAAPLATIDFATLRLPDILVLPTFLVVALVLVATAVHNGQWSDAGRGVGTALVLSLAFLGLSVASRGDLGLGDVKLAGLIGIVVGPHGWMTTMLAVVAGFAVAAVVAVRRLLAGRRRPRSPMPLGPHLIVGALLALLLQP